MSCLFFREIWREEGYRAIVEPKASLGEAVN